MTKRKQSLKLPVSFKKNIRDLELYNYVLEQKETLGISTYIKLLIEKDMKEKGLWKFN